MGHLRAVRQGVSGSSLPTFAWADRSIPWPNGLISPSANRCCSGPCRRMAAASGRRRSRSPSGSRARRRLDRGRAGRRSGPRRRPGRPSPRGHSTSRTSGRSSQASIRSVSSALAHGVGPGPGRTVSAVASRAASVVRGCVGGADVPAATSRPCRTTAISQPPPGSRAGRRPPRAARSARSAAASGPRPAAARPAGPGPGPPPRTGAGAASALDPGQQRRHQLARVAGDRLARTARPPAARTPRGLIRSSHGAAQRPELGQRAGGRGAPGRQPAGALAQRQRLVDRVGGQLGRVRGSRTGRGRSPPSARTWRDQDSRGYASAVSLSQTVRSGNFERRLYGGLCAAIRRSSRTSASSEWAHSTASTRSAMWIISEIRLRRLGGGEVAAHPGRDRAAGADVERPVAARRGRGRRPGASGSPSARWRLRALGGRDRLGELDRLLQRVDLVAAQPPDQRVQHLDRGPGVVQRPVGRPGGGAEVARPACRAGGWAPRRG